MTLRHLVYITIGALLTLPLGCGDASNASDDVVHQQPEDGGVDRGDAEPDVGEHADADVRPDADARPGADARPDAAVKESFQLTPSDNGHYLVDSDGSPHFILGDTAWTLPENATREDVDDYIADRKQRGFNYFQIVAARDLDGEGLAPNSTRTMNPENRYGHLPFAWTPEGKADVTQPEQVDGGSPSAPNDYWDHLEYIVQHAKAAGMHIGILPVWGKYYINAQDPSMRLFDDASAKGYGAFLGDRLKSYDNIIWIVGGDCDPVFTVDAKSIYRSMAEGLLQGATGDDAAWDEDDPAWKKVSITTHLQNDPFGAEPWVQPRMIYYHDPDIHPETLSDWQDQPTKPLLIGESRYEGWIWNDMNIDALFIRRQLYHALFAGAHGGYVYGSAMSSKQANDQLFKFQSGWRERLDLPGANAMRHLAALAQDNQWWDWEPAQGAILEGLSEAYTLKTATTTRSGDRLLVYFPDPSSALIDATKITTHPRAKVSWIDPRTGEATVGPVFTLEPHSFTPPASLEDAILVLQGTDDPVGEPISNARFKTLNGEVVLAAENYDSIAGSLGTWTQQDSEPGFIGLGYMVSSLDNAELTFKAELPHMSYAIDFQQTGTYYVHLRTLAKAETENGFFATFDNKEINYGGLNPDSGKTAFYIWVKWRNQWNWYTDGGGAEGRNLKVSFTVSTPGTHVFSLYRRDRGSRVDHIWLTKHEATAADDLTPPPASQFLK